MTTSQILEEIKCRRDDKARRVSNVAPDQHANITADQLERGVTLEALEALQVPVLRYSGQVTIHGIIPEFSDAARPGGYKAVFRNGNGSVGVRYIAIDAEKKALIQRACRANGLWHASKTSAGFEVSRQFIVRDESLREQAKVDALAALRGLPTDLFYGNAYAGTLAYGAGYYVSAHVGAIPSGNLWALINALTGLPYLLSLEAIESTQALHDQAAAILSDIESDKRFAEETAKHADSWNKLLPSLKPISAIPDNAEVVVKADLGYLRVKLEKVKGRAYYTVTENTKYTFDRTIKRHAMLKGFPWPKALAAGKVFRVKP